MSQLEINTILYENEIIAAQTKIWYAPEISYIFNLDENYKLNFATNINLMIKNKDLKEIPHEKNYNYPTETFKHVHNDFTKNYFIKWEFRFEKQKIILVVDPMNLYIQGLLRDINDPNEKKDKKYYYHFNDAVIRKISDYTSKELMFDGHYQKLMGDKGDIDISYFKIEKAMTAVAELNDDMVKKINEELKKYFALIVLFSAEALRFFRIRNFIFLIFEQQAYNELFHMENDFLILNENIRWRRFEPIVKNWNSNSLNYYNYKKDPNKENKANFDSIKNLLTVLNIEK